MDRLAFPRLRAKWLGQLADDGVGDIALAPGVWCLHTESTVPYVKISAGKYARTITWGEAIAIDQQGKVENVSWHTGDVWIAPVVEGVVAPPPSSITLPALIEEDLSVNVGTIGRWRSQWIDVRRAKRVFYQQTLSIPATYPATQVQQRTERGLNTDAQGAGAMTAGGLVQYTKTPAAGDLAINLAPALSSAQPGDTRPGAFLDALRVGFVANPGAVLPWVTLEYA